MPRPPNPVVRERLIAMGQGIIYEHGFNGSGVQDITAAANIPKGSFYNYFESKESFAVEILENYWQSIESRHGKLLRDGKTKPLVRVQKFFHGLSMDHRENGFDLGCLIGNMSLELSLGSEMVRRKLADVLFSWEGLLATCLREAQAAGELDSKADVGALAAILIESYEGAVMRSKVEKSGKACERFEKVVLPRLLL